VWHRVKEPYKERKEGDLTGTDKRNRKRSLQGQGVLCILQRPAPAAPRRAEAVNLWAPPQIFYDWPAADNLSARR